MYHTVHVLYTCVHVWEYNALCTKLCISRIVHWYNYVADRTRYTSLYVKNVYIGMSWGIACSFTWSWNCCKAAGWKEQSHRKNQTVAVFSAYTLKDW